MKMATLCQEQQSTHKIQEFTSFPLIVCCREGREKRLQLVDERGIYCKPLL